MNLGALIAVLVSIALFVAYCILDRKIEHSAPCSRETCGNADDVTCEECEARDARY